MSRNIAILFFLSLLLWPAYGSHLLGDNDRVAWMFPTASPVGEVRPQISYEYEKDGSIMTLKVNLPIYTDKSGNANSIWWLKVKSGEKGVIADFLKSPAEGIEVSIGMTESKFRVNKEKIDFLRTFMERYPIIFKNQLESGDYNTGSLGDKKDEFEKEYRKHRFFNIVSPMVWSAEFGLNYSALDYIRLTDASYAEESDQKWGLVGRGSFGIYLNSSGMLGFTMAYEKKWKKPESKDSLPEGFPIPMKWLSGPTYFEGLVKEEKIECIAEYKKYLGSYLGLNPGVSVGSYLPGIDKNYFYAGFLGMYYSPKDEGFSMGVKVMYEYLKSKDEGKPSLTLFLSKAFGLK